MAKKKPVIVVAPKQKEEFEMQNTAQAQIDSLTNFMAQLGYTPARANGGFVTENKALKANRNISTATAIKLHNMKRKEWILTDTGWYFPGFDIKVDIYLAPVAFNMMQASKLFKKVKLQHSRLGIQLQSHMVKPLDKAYTLLLNLAA